MRRDRKFLFSLVGRLKGWGRGRKWYWMVGRSVHKFLRTWLGFRNILNNPAPAPCSTSFPSTALANYVPTLTQLSPLDFSPTSGTVSQLGCCRIHTILPIIIVFTATFLTYVSYS